MLLNAPTAISAVLQIVLPLLPARQRQKIVVCPGPTPLAEIAAKFDCEAMHAIIEAPCLQLLTA